MNASVLKAPPVQSASWKRRLFWILLSAMAALLVAALACYLFPQQILTVDSGPVKADAMVVMGGAWWSRPQRAAELFKEGEAPRIICSGYGDCDFNKRLLKKDGVTNAAIILEGKSHTTRQNAEFSIPLLRQMGAHRVILVTSWYHSRRALMCFEHYAPDITFYSRPSYYGYVSKEQRAGSGEQGAEKTRQRAEWKRVRGYANSEYVKLLGYWVCYGVCPL